MTGFVLPEAPPRPDWPHALPDHLSASALTQYHRCRNQFFLHYIRGESEPPKGYRVWGSADSAAAEHNFSQKVVSHIDVAVSEIEEVFAASVDEQIDAYGGASQIDWEGGTPADVKDRGVALAALYHRQAAPTVQPIASEQRFSITIPDVPVPLIGYVDVETASETIERKTSKSKFKNGLPDGNYIAQARIYQLALGKPVHWHVSTKTKLPAVYTPAEEPGMVLDVGAEESTMRWIQSTVRAILSDIEEFGTNEPWPGAHVTAMSPCSWCGWGPNAARTCAWWSG